MSEIGEHYLYPGEIFSHIKPYIVTTVLGSCVSVCLWDEKIRIGGINHYQLSLWNGEGLASPKYGNIAIEKLIDKLIKMGSDIKNLRAKIFGGGAVIQVKNSTLNIGERNIKIALELLEENRIPIISSDVGGKEGRKLKYNTESGLVLVKRIQSQVRA